MSIPARHPSPLASRPTFGGTPLLRLAAPVSSDTPGARAFSRPWNDRRVPALMALARDPRTAIVSVDCFDTILWRRTAKPTDVFVVLGEELRRAGLLDSGLDPHAFGRLRTAAEVVARQRKHAAAGSSEVDLGEIYAELPDYVSSLSREQLRAREVAVERRLTVPDHELCEALASLGPGVSLMVVSDTYLSAEELTTLIDRPGFGVLADALVFTSCEVGTGKEADLWRLLPARLGVAPEAIVHVGNNRRADYLKPEAAGVRALHWAELSDGLSEVLAREVDFRVDGERDAGEDHGVTALRGRARFSLYAGPPEQEPAWQAGVEILGPVLSGYADWVFERTAELGIDRAICVMREGRFFKALFDAGRAGSVNPGLESGLLWASRTAMTRVLLAGAGRAEIEQALMTPRPASIPGAADLLGIDLRRFPTFAALADQAPHLAEDPSALALFLDAVWQTPGTLEEIQARAQRRHANFLAHLRAVIGDRAGDVALLDIGWQGSNQERLQQIINAAGLGVRLHGFYVSADTTPLDRLLRGHRIEGFIPGRPVGSDGRQSAFFRNRVMLETLFLTGDGSTLEIGDDGAPVLAPNHPSPGQTALTDAVQAGILAYCRHVGDYRAAGAGSDTARISGRDARTVLERFVCAPTPAEAELFGGILHDDSHSNMESLALVPRADDLWARRLSSSQLQDARWERVWWAAGAEAKWRHSRVAGAPADLSPAGVLRLALARRGAGELEAKQVVLRVGADGTTVGSYKGVGNDLARLVLYPTITPGLLRLDGLELFLATASNGWRRRVWAWRTGDDVAALGLAGAQWIAPGVLSVSPHSQLTITLEAPLPLPSYFELEFRAGFIPLVDGSARLESEQGRVTVGFAPLVS